MFGMVPYRNADFLKEGETVSFDPGIRYVDCLEDIEEAKRIARALGKDYIVVDQTDPAFGFPVVPPVKLIDDTSSGAISGATRACGWKLAARAR